PTTLLAILKIVENIWRLEKQNQYATEIAGRAGQLYDKFVGFVDDLDSVGQQIDKTQKSFESARSKLTSGKGNLVRQAEMLQDLGAKTTKQLPAGLGEDPGDVPKDS
ncbi:MAG: DNA recombination protein RmuC, partial [Gammaproteobacteria bacterium]|nr:DNA recombination protein RmuC [Gammaproteobacteria bacterium]